MLWPLSFSSALEIQFWKLDNFSSRQRKFQCEPTDPLQTCQNPQMSFEKVHLGLKHQSYFHRSPRHALHWNNSLDKSRDKFDGTAIHPWITNGTQTVVVLDRILNTSVVANGLFPQWFVSASPKWPSTNLMKPTHLDLVSLLSERGYRSCSTLSGDQFGSATLNTNPLLLATKAHSCQEEIVQYTCIAGRVN